MQIKAQDVRDIYLNLLWHYPRFFDRDLRGDRYTYEYGLPLLCNILKSLRT